MLKDYIFNKSYSKMIDGINQIFHTNGKVKEEFILVNKKREGFHRKWNKEGEMVYEALYKNDEKVGITIIKDTIYNKYLCISYINANSLKEAKDIFIQSKF